jgi:SAM-dependent methyltransferase
MIAVGGLAHGQSILEIGSGLGKFTLPLAARGYTLVANDLSPALLARLTQAADGRISTICCDAAEIRRHTSASFDRVIGFFVLHHLTNFDCVFQALADVLKPGGRIAFCEPVAWNPLYYLQIAFAPGMRFAGEPSITAMRSRVMLPAMSRAGLTEVASDPYGYFPPFLKNRPWGSRLENWLEQRACVPFPHAFQVFTARKPL